MNPLYNLGIKAYRIGARIAMSRNVKAQKMILGQQNSFPALEAAIQPGQKWVWVHAASLGEFEQGRPMIEKLRRERPGLKILLSFFSPSGYEVRKNYPDADLVVYLPFDTPDNARRWVEIVKPVAAIFVKYEFWGNYMQSLHRAKIPVYLISAIFRDSQIFFKPWGGTFRKILRYYTHLFVQDSASAERLARIGVTNVTVAGDTRFDRVTDIMRTAHDIDGMNTFVADAPMVFVAGSSWQPDEELFIPWLKANPQVKSIIAPHEFNDDRIASLRDQLGEVTVLMSEIKADPTKAASARHIIVNCFGLLSSLYRYGHVAYIGGGFGTGIHNINEAAVYGIPVLFGPNHRKFKEAGDMIECHGGAEITDSASINAVLDRFLTNADHRRECGKAAADYISRNIGATDKIFKIIF